MKKMFAVCAAAAAVTTVSAMAVSADGITATPNTTNDSVVVKLSPGSSVSDVVRVGDSTNDKFYEAEFTYGKKPGSTRLLGDVNGDGKIKGNDALQIARYTVELITLSGDDLQAADTNDDGKVKGNDALQIARYTVELPSSIGDGTKTISDKKNFVPEG